MEQSPIQRILCPVDFSETSARALRYAAGLRARWKAHLTVLHADLMELPPYFTEVQLDLFERAWRESEDAAKQHLRKFVSATLPWTPSGIQTLVLWAAPVEAILQTAAETKADLIVLGTHGRNSPRSIRGLLIGLLGATAEHVLHSSHIPVITIPESFEVVEDELHIKSILCPVNNTAAARKSLEYAATIARCVGAALTTLQVRESGAYDVIEDLQAWVSSASRPGLEIRALALEGKPAHEVLRIASDQGIDLLVVSACPHTFFDRTVIGSTTSQVVRHAPCPVLTIPTLKESS